ncbi:MAG: sigma-70 family RNA polymerase sigma factor [Spirulinaceae cyanobacterium]
MSEFDGQLDEQLKQLALTAQQYPFRSLERQKALNQLISFLQQSGGLCSPKRTDGAQYQEVKDEGRSRLFKYICENIDKYNPEKGEVLQWANFLLDKRFYIEAYRELNTEGRNMPPRPSLDDLENLQMISEIPEESPIEELRRFIAEDPENVFQKAHIQGHPKASFKFIALQKLDGYSWEEISQQLHNIPVPTLSSFYQRSLKRFISLLRDYLSD